MTVDLSDISVRRRQTIQFWEKLFPDGFILETKLLDGSVCISRNIFSPYPMSEQLDGPIEALLLKLAAEGSLTAGPEPDCVLKEDGNVCRYWRLAPRR